MQNKNQINLNPGPSAAARKYLTDPDYFLFIAKKIVSIIEARYAEEGFTLTIHDNRSGSTLQLN